MFGEYAIAFLANKIAISSWHRNQVDRNRDSIFCGHS